MKPVTLNQVSGVQCLPGLFLCSLLKSIYKNYEGILINCVKNGVGLTLNIRSRNMGRTTTKFFITWHSSSQIPLYEVFF